MSKEPEITGIDGTVRKAHYGAGLQPWDVIKDLGWGHIFAACNVLKYIRRYMNKNGQDDIDKARWYWVELNKLCLPRLAFVSRFVFNKLKHELTSEEISILCDLAEKKVA